VLVRTAHLVPAAQLLDRPPIHAILDQASGEGLSQYVERYFLETGLLAGGVKGIADESIACLPSLYKFETVVQTKGVPGGGGS
jgi:hypothetical protein